MAIQSANRSKNRILIAVGKKDFILNIVALIRVKDSCM
jgi:hypothetical protein